LSKSDLYVYGKYRELMETEGLFGKIIGEVSR